MIQRTEPGASERLRRESSAAAEPGPTDQQREEQLILGSRLGRGLDPQNTTRVSFPFLRHMADDHGVSMGLHYVTMPCVKASFYFEADDARAAAFADNMIRPIFGTTVLGICRMLSTGYAPAVKNTMAINPGWQYRVDGDLKRVWDSSSVDALVYKPLSLLRPESCKLHYDSDGAYDGIQWDEAFAGQGGFYLNGTLKPSIDLSHAFWAAHGVEGEDGCSPPDETVLTTDGYVPIGDLDPSVHRLVSYSNNRIYRGNHNRPDHDKGYGFRSYTRHHSGDLLTIRTGGQGSGVRSTRVTPNHKLTVCWSEEASRYWCVYLMKRGNHWRIGTTRVLGQKSKQTNSGVGSRMHREKAEEAWILGVYESRSDALFHETLWSNIYRVPDACFVGDRYVKTGMTQDDLNRFWESVDSYTGAKELLGARNLLESFPAYKKVVGGAKARQAGVINKWTIHAANLLPGLMNIPTDPGCGSVPSWKSFSVTREHYDGPVVSLDVDPYHHYVSGDGVITQNSPYGKARIAYCAPIFHMYRYIWTLLGRAFENNADPGPIVWFPKDDAAAGPDGESNKDVALMIGRRKRSGSTIALPSDVYTDYMDRMTNRPKWDITYPQSTTNFADIQEFLGYLEALKFRALWISEQSLTEGAGGSSSRNVVSSMSSQRDSSQVGLMEQIIGFIMDQLVRPAMAMNMPWYEGKLEMKTIGFGQDDEDTVRQFFQLMGQQDLSQFGVDAYQLAKSRGMPMQDPAEHQRVLDAAAKVADGAPAPAVTPTQGRRALVTQTGFGEMVYEQLHDPTSLSSVADGDFAVSLRASDDDAWSIPSVVDAARTVRSRVSDFLAVHYRDAAIFASKRDGAARELLADSDDVLAPERTADAVAASWAPDHNAVDRLGEAVGAALTRACEATRDHHLRRLSATASVDHSSWVQDHARSVLSYSLSQVRADLSQDLADGFREGSSARDVSVGLRRRARAQADSVADHVALGVVSAAYRTATVLTGLAAGVTHAQVLDAGADRGLVVRLADPTQSYDRRLRLLPSAPPDLSVRRIDLDDGLLARYDEDAHVALLSPGVGLEQEARFMIALGDQFAART